MHTKLKLVLIVSAAAIFPGIAQQPEPKRPLGVPADAKHFGGKWYRVYLEKVPWKIARDKCARLGGQLAVVPDEETHAFIKELSKGLHLWLGATDEKVEGLWVWVDGTEMQFKAWFPGEPGNLSNKEHYLFIFRDGLWGDIRNDPPASDGNAPVGYICEWPKK